MSKAKIKMFIFLICAVLISLSSVYATDDVNTENTILDSEEIYDSIELSVEDSNIELSVEYSNIELSVEYSNIELSVEDSIGIEFSAFEDMHTIFNKRTINCKLH